MSGNTVALVLCLVLVIISVAAQILLPTPSYPDAPVHTATEEQQQLSASKYEVTLYVRRLHNDSYVMCAQLPVGDIEGEFLLDSGFKGPAIINTWYAARYHTGVHFEDLGDDDPITPASEKMNIESNTGNNSSNIKFSNWKRYVNRPSLRDKVRVAIQSKQLRFVHIPKTGGTSLKKWLLTNDVLDIQTLGHNKAAKSQTLTFTILRDPVKRFESLMNYRLQAFKRPRRDWPRHLKYLNDDISVSLNHVVELMTDAEILDFKPFRTMSFYADNIDIFITIEELVPFLNYFIRDGSVNSGYELVARKNVSEKQRGTFNQESIERISRLYADDVRLYNACIRDAAALPPYLRRQSITLQGIHGQKTVTVGIHELNCAYAALRHMWSLALPNAPHILTIDTMVKMQPLHLRLRAGASRMSAFLEPDAAAQLAQTMKRPEQRWRHGLLEVQVAVDDRLVWCVFDTGLSSSLYLASEVSEHSDRANMKDVNGVTQCLPCKLQTVKLVGVAQSCSVTYGKPRGKRRGYLGMGFLRYFDILLLNNIVYVTESD